MTIRTACRSLALALSAATLLAGAVAAAGPTPQAAIAARQANYKKMGAAMKALGDQIKSGSPAKDVVLASARTIAGIAPQQLALFPPGSGPSAGVRTDALPAIWSDRATFEGNANRLVAESAKLAQLAAGGDMAAVAAQMKATGAVCGGCHRQFRADT